MHLRLVQLKLKSYYILLSRVLFLLYLPHTQYTYLRSTYLPTEYSATLLRLKAEAPWGSIQEKDSRSIATP